MLPIIEFHILQSFPVSCLNRDDVNSPKTAVIGGLVRARVSSQCWKRAIRLKLHEQGGKIAQRTSKLAKVLESKASQYCDDEKKLQKAAEGLASQLIAQDALIFLSDSEIDDLVQLLRDSDFSKSADLKEFLKVHGIKKSKAKSGSFRDALDIALFGRMVAKNSELGVEAACSVAHAITTHKMDSEIDFYTAVSDDESATPGAAFMGISEFSGGTFYRYLCLDVRQLAENLGIDADHPSPEDMLAVKDAVSLFTRAVFVAVPAARQHTMAALCPWDYARILVRTGQGIQVSFDHPVKSKEGYLKPSIEALDMALQRHEQIFGEKLYGKVADIAFGQNELSLEDVILKLGEAIDG